ncbi:MAG: tetratricopeptide repeat protein [Candidatus Latescibacterota bacterium]
MSLIADALKKVQKTRMAQVRKPGEGRLRGILPPMRQISSHRRLLTNPFVLLGAAVSLSVLAVVAARPFLPSLGFRESERTNLAPQDPAPAALQPIYISQQEEYALEPTAGEADASPASYERWVQSLSAPERPVVSSLPGRAQTDAEEKNPTHQAGSVGAPASAQVPGPYGSGQGPGTRSDLTGQITSKSKLSETIRTHYNLGVTYQKQGQLSQAMKEYEKVVQLDPSNVEAHNNLGLIHKDMGELDAAMAEYQKAISINPDHWKAHHNLGVVYYLKGDLEKASSEYKSALGLNPGDLAIHNNLGLIFKKQGRFPEAKEMFLKALTIDPSHPETYYNLALTMEQAKDFSGAVSSYLKFIRFSKDPHSALVENVRKHLVELGK